MSTSRQSAVSNLTTIQPTITIRRSGKFKVPGLVPHNQCGVLGQTEFNFALKITVRQLDHQGFVCDNFDVVPSIVRHFENGSWEASCEQLAGTVVYIMHRVCSGRAEKIEVEVSPIPEAGVTVVWEKEWALPTFYAKRLDKINAKGRKRAAGGEKVLSKSITTKR